MSSKAARGLIVFLSAAWLWGCSEADLRFFAPRASPAACSPGREAVIGPDAEPEVLPVLQKQTAGWDWRVAEPTACRRPGFPLTPQHTVPAAPPAGSTTEIHKSIQEILSRLEPQPSIRSRPSGTPAGPGRGAVAAPPRRPPDSEQILGSLERLHKVVLEIETFLAALKAPEEHP